MSDLRPATESIESSSTGGARGRTKELLSFIATLALVLILLEAALAGIGWINHNVLQHGWVPGFVASCLSLYLHIVLFGGALAAVEFFLPGSGTPKRYGHAALFWAFYVPVAVGSAEIASRVVTHFHVTPLLSFHFDALTAKGPAGIAMNAGTILLGAFLLDFFYYWFHRLQHKLSLLWAFHSVHHANRSLNALGCYHHPLEDLWRIPLFLLPMALAFEVVAPRLVLISTFVTAWGVFNHMDSSFNLGRLRNFLADNHYHRVHHSIAREHYDVNFAGMFSVWDRLFSTQIMPGPAADKLPVGLLDTPHPQTLWQYLAGPVYVLRRARRDARSKA